MLPTIFSHNWFFPHNDRHQPFMSPTACVTVYPGPEGPRKIPNIGLALIIWNNLLWTDVRVIQQVFLDILAAVSSWFIALSLISERVQQRDSRRDLEGGSICHQKTVVHPGATRFFSPADHCALSLLQSLSLPPAFMFLLPHAEQKTFSFPFSGCFYCAWVKLRARVNRLEEKFRSPWMLRHYNNIVALSRN